jgi:hypothetical protein
MLSVIGAMPCTEVTRNVHRLCSSKSLHPKVTLHKSISFIFTRYDQIIQQYLHHLIHLHTKPSWKHIFSSKSWVNVNLRWHSKRVLPFQGVLWKSINRGPLPFQLSSYILFKLYFKTPILQEVYKTWTRGIFFWAKSAKLHPQTLRNERLSSCGVLHWPRYLVRLDGHVRRTRFALPMV